VGELAAVADLVVLRIDAGVELGLGIEARLDLTAAGGIEKLRRRAELGQGTDARLGERRGRAPSAAGRESRWRARSRGAAAPSARAGGRG
jgi:hypothetical protein